MIEIEMTIYKCEHCGKIYQMKFYCNEHELKCRKNPANDRPCIHCDYLEMKDFEYDYNPDNDSYISKGYALFCNKLKHFVHPPYIKTPYSEDDLECENIPMPTVCEHG